MSSIEFDLARLTAQTPSMETRVQGSAPELSKAFIAQCAGKIADWKTYHAVMSRYCDDEHSMHELGVSMEEWAWKHAGLKYPHKAFKRHHMMKISELGVLFFVNPKIEEKRTARQCAAYTEMDLLEWQSRYHHVRDMVVHELAQLQSAAVYQLRMIMTDE